MSQNLCNCFVTSTETTFTVFTDLYKLDIPRFIQEFQFYSNKYIYLLI